MTAEPVLSAVRPARLSDSVLCWRGRRRVTQACSPLPFPSLTILDFALYEKPVFLHVGAMVFIPLGSEAPWRSPRAARAWVPGGLSSGGCRKAHFRVEVWGFI